MSEWHPARIVSAKNCTRHGRPCVTVKFELLEGPYKGFQATDITEPLSVFYQCHHKALLQALGGSSPREGDRLDVQVEGRRNNLSVKYKGYRRARSSAG